MLNVEIIEKIESSPELKNLSIDGLLLHALIEIIRGEVEL